MRNRAIQRKFPFVPSTDEITDLEFSLGETQENIFSHDPPKSIHRDSLHPDPDEEHSDGFMLMITVPQLFFLPFSHLFICCRNHLHPGHFMISTFHHLHRSQLMRRSRLITKFNSISEVKPNQILPSMIKRLLQPILTPSNHQLIKCVIISIITDPPRTRDHQQKPMLILFP